MSPGTNYDYHIQAWNLGGYTDFAGFSTTTISTPPASPSATVGNGQVTLAWTASPGAISYNIYRGTAPGAEVSQPIASGVTGVNYIDNGLRSGFTYFYKITAVSKGGESAASAEVAANLGGGDGLLGLYYGRTDLTGTSIQRIDPQLNFDWQNGSPMAGIPSDKFSVAWMGTIKPPTSSSYTFYTTSDDGVRLYVNGQRVIDNWTQHGATENASAPIVLSAGQNYSLRMEYFENTGAAVAQLRWSSSQFTKTLIPKSYLYSTFVPAAPTNLIATKGTAQVALTWTASLGAKTYNIYRGTAAGGEAVQPIATGVTATSFVDSGLNSGGTYFYQVTAVSSLGESPRSAEVSATPTGNGLLGTYYSGANFTGTAIQRIDSQVNFNWQTGSPMAGIPADGFSVAWTGGLKPATTGNYTFYTTSDDGVRLYVNGQLVINNWTDHGATENASKAVSLTGGQIYAVRMEYYEHVGSAVAQLRWSSSQVAKALIPQSVLFSGSPIVQGAAVVRSALVAAPATTSTTSSSAPSHSSVVAGSLPQTKPAIDAPAELITLKMSRLAMDRITLTKHKRQLSAESFGFDQAAHEEVFAQLHR